MADTDADARWTTSLARDAANGDRAAVEARLDALVRANRFTIAVVFPTVGAVLLVASAEGLPQALLSAALAPVGYASVGRELGRRLAFNPWLVLAGVAVMRAPLLVGVAPLVDRRAAGWLGLLVGYAYAIEFVGIHTGWPYGEFAYGASLGPTIGGVPVGLPVFFVPLVVNAYLLCLLLLGDRAASPLVRLPVTVGAVVLMDLALDPGAVSLGFWSYAGGGPYYGVPVSNYLGWVLSATATVAALDRAFARPALLDRLASCEFALDDLVSFVLLWAGVNLWFGNFLPALFAALLGVGLVRADRFDAGALRP
ncbi:MAG: bisanhydrobacterioruberin hydratase [Haloferacaceae archaeon]